jgi:transcriptional regulator with XRE-family HTH domain
LQLGLQQKDAARRLEIPIDTLRTYEYARVSMRFRVAWRFATIFRVNLGWLATGAKELKDYARVSSDLARFIPPSFLLSTVFDSVIRFFPQTKVTNSNPSGWMSDNLVPIGINDERIERNRRDSMLAEIQSILRVLPADLATKFVSLLDEAADKFRASHGDQLNKIIARGESRAITNRTEAGLAANAVIVSNALGLNAEAVIAANRSFPAELLDSDFEPPRNSLEIAIVRHFASQITPKNTVLTEDTGIRSVGLDETCILQMPTEKHFPTRLTKALTKAGLTVAAAAEKWGINRRTIEDWKQGRSTPRGINLRFVEEALAEIEQKS